MFVLQFDADKMGNDEYSDSYRNKLNRDMDNMEYMLLKTWESHDKCLRKYGGLMRESFERVSSYFSEIELMNLHRTSKSNTLAQVYFGFNLKDINIECEKKCFFLK